MKKLLALLMVSVLAYVSAYAKDKKFDRTLHIESLESQTGVYVDGGAGGTYLWDKMIGEIDGDKYSFRCVNRWRWSNCFAFEPGDWPVRWVEWGSSLEVQYEDKKGALKTETIYVVDAYGRSTSQKSVPATAQQTASTTQQPQTPPAQEAKPSIEAPKSDTAGASAGFPPRWKSMTTGALFTLRFEKEFIYAEAVLPDAWAKAGMFNLMDVKKDGDKYVGKWNWNVVSPAGKSCTGTNQVELILLTPERIEGRTFVAAYPNASIDWNTCTYSQPADWHSFVWIPVR